MILVASPLVRMERHVYPQTVFI